MWELIATHPAILGAIAALGGLSVIMAYLSSPAVAVAFGAVLNFVLGTRVGCAALALTIGLFIGDIHGTRVESAKWDRADAQVEIQRHKRDAALALEVARQANETLEEFSKENNELTNKVKEYEAELQKRKQPACTLTPDDVKRLRNFQ